MEENKVTLKFGMKNDYVHEDIKAKYIVPEENFNIYVFKRYCKYFAAACGFADQNIEEAFGEDE